MKENYAQKILDYYTEKKGDALTSGEQFRILNHFVPIKICLTDTEAKILHEQIEKNYEELIKTGIPSFNFFKSVPYASPENTTHKNLYYQVLLDYKDSKIDYKTVCYVEKLLKLNKEQNG